MAIFTFDDIVALNDGGLRLALQNIDYFTLIDALKTAGEPVRDKVCVILPKKVAARLKDALENAGGPSQAESEKAQMEIVGAIKRINDDGWHDIQEGDDFAFPDPPKDEATGTKNPVPKYIEESFRNEGRTLFLEYETEDDIRKGFEEFQTRQDELARIRSLYVSGDCLSAVCEYIAADKIEKLSIHNAATLPNWDFLGKFRGLKDLEIVDPAFIPESIGGLQSLTKLSLSIKKEITALPESIGDLKNLTSLGIGGSPLVAQFPESMGRLQSLTELSLYDFAYPRGSQDSPKTQWLDWVCGLRSLKSLKLHGLREIKALPDSLGNLKNLEYLDITLLRSLEQVPESIGGLQALTKLFLSGNENIKVLPEGIGRLQSLERIWVEYCEKIEALPESLGDLKNLAELSIKNMRSLEQLPESIGGLQALTKLCLEGNKKLASLPDGIGRLEKLSSLSVKGSPLVKCLPKGVANLTSLEYVNLFGTGIESVPRSVSSAAKFVGMKRFATIPTQGSISYRGFVNAYYTIIMTVSGFRDRAGREGLLALEEDIESMGEDFLKTGVRLVIDGTDKAIIRQVLTLSIEREHDFYRKKLMGIAMEGVLGIQAGEPTAKLILRLNLMVDIKDNPINAAHEKYIRGDRNAFSNIDFASAIRPEVEREEVSMLKRAVEMNELSRCGGLLALESRLDAEAIAAGDVFEYGLSLIAESHTGFWMGLESEYISATLDRLVERAIDPVQKNLALAKKEAVLSIFAGENSRILTAKMSAYVDKDIAKMMEGEMLMD